MDPKHERYLSLKRKIEEGSYQSLSREEKDEYQSLKLEFKNKATDEGDSSAKPATTEQPGKKADEGDGILRDEWGYPVKEGDPSDMFPK